jgi:hypothetical protein
MKPVSAALDCPVSRQIVRFCDATTLRGAMETRGSTRARRGQNEAAQQGCEETRAMEANIPRPRRPPEAPRNARVSSNSQPPQPRRQDSKFSKLTII